MADILTVRYAHTGKSSSADALGMRKMQARAYKERNAQHLLIKAPPASGKSRALMFIALDKVYKQGLQKVIVAVPEVSIGGSFRDTDLRSHGFFADWHVDPQYNLCSPGNEGKVDQVLRFMNDPDAHFLLCTHATFRYAYERIRLPAKFDQTLIAIDEFHHTSVEDGNRMGRIVHELLTQSQAHLVAMTGSYFRGDAIAIISEEDEAKFTQVTYTYYEQLNGYKYLKSLGIGYHFYQGRYFEALRSVLDLNKKTIIYIPNVNSMESTGEKYTELDRVMDCIGSDLQRDANGIYTVKGHNGRKLKVADLVTDDKMREKVLAYLRAVKNKEDVDIIIALGMAKEGFDWPWCEHVLTVGYRSSLTEIVQIIGRATRDCPGKEHAQFTNLIAQPQADDADVTNSVNNMLKAITVSLLMEQILAPNVTFKPRSLLKAGEDIPPGTVIVDDTGSHHVSQTVADILSNGGLDNVVTSVMQDLNAVGRLITGAVNDQEFSQLELPLMVQKKFPSMNEEDVKTISKFCELQMKIHASGGQLDDTGALIDRTGKIIVELPREAVTPKEIGKGRGRAGSGQGEENPPDDREPWKPEDNNAPTDKNKKSDFLKVGNKFLNIENLNVDLIAHINPFQGAFEVLSKSIDAPLLKTIKAQVVADRSGVTDEEAQLLWSNVREYVQQYGREPSADSNDAYERRLGEVLAYTRNRYAQMKASGAIQA